MSEPVVYPGRDLESMSFAVNYHRWILEIFSAYLGERLVEVGAGTGSFSELLLARTPATLTLVEPSGAMHEKLLARIQSLDTPTQVHTYHALFRDVAGDIKRERQPDSIIYINVLEHVREDVDELVAVQQTLDAGGRVFLFVPALPGLYGNFDREVGHFRRYVKRELEDKCRRAGFEIVRSAYFDVLGVAPWWIKYRLLKSATLDVRSVKLYDRYAVRVAKAFESLIRHPPFGKNLILIAEKK